MYQEVKFFSCYTVIKGYYGRATLYSLKKKKKIVLWIKDPFFLMNIWSFRHILFICFPTCFVFHK